ncbi:MAG: T9SS C-terminal target domain-containing protein [Calditrichaeota bacterium]|nr:MAG: T9SS C-terminal target domain-containing protein [Calditrichota bacterium]
MNRKFRIKFILVIYLICAPLLLGGVLSGQGHVVYPSQTSPTTINPAVQPGMVLLKLRESALPQVKSSKESFQIQSPALNSRLQKLGAHKIEQFYAAGKMASDKQKSGIDRIVKVYLADFENPVDVARKLTTDPNVEYAEPVFINEICEVPTDSLYYRQFYLPQINAPDAWAEQKGNPAVIIAIVDNGVDYVHRDLKDNVWVNEAEANGLPGFDDDGNGYVDDIHGWDFGNNDALPMHISQKEGHGTIVAGLASATTENETGVAGASWNCTFMPVKCARDAVPTNILFGYEGIIYAADNGADIINVSWGTFGYSRVGQDVINYAHSKGALVICAAGNYTSAEPFYPAAYHNTIAVAAVDDVDRLTSYSNFGTWVDISAPGGELQNGLFSTLPDNQYGEGSGTSFASPLVAGMCGLIKSRFPNSSPDDISKHLLFGADSIDMLNPGRENLLGYGRLNALRALDENPDYGAYLPARLHVFSYSIADSAFGNGNNVFERGEQLSLDLQLQNFSLSNNDRTRFSITSNNPHILIENYSLGPFPFPADTTLNVLFTFKILENAVAGMDSLQFVMESVAGFSATQTFYFMVGQSPILFIDHDLSSILKNVDDISGYYTDILNANKIPYSYWDTGLIDFPDSEFLAQYPLLILAASPAETQRIDKKQRSILRKYLDSGGNLFIAGANVASYLSGHPFREPLDFLNNYLHAEYVSERETDFSLNGVPGDPIGDGMAFQLERPFSEAVFHNPDILDRTGSAIPVFSYNDGSTAGLRYSGEHKLVYFGFGLESVDFRENTIGRELSPVRAELLLRTINWLNIIEHQPRSVSDGENSSELFTVRLSNYISTFNSLKLFWRKNGAGRFTEIDMKKTQNGDFVAQLADVDSYWQIDYYFQLNHDYYTWKNPIGAPDAYYTMQRFTTQSPEQVADKFQFNLLQNYPNPFNPRTNINYQIPKRAHVELSVYNLTGQLVQTLISNEHEPGNYTIEWDGKDLASGAYFYRLASGANVEVKKLLLLK